MCALIKVNLPAENYNVKEISIESASQGLTGEYSMLWEATSTKQTLKLNSFKSEVKEVTLANEDGSNLTPGASYYAVVWPGQHNGLTFTFTDKDDKVCVKNLDKTVNCEVGKITVINVKSFDEFKEPDPELTVTTTDLNFSAAGGEKELTFNTNKDWTISTDASTWIEISDKSGSKGEITVKVKCYEESLYKERTGNITITAGGLTQTIKVTQEAAVKVISLEVSTTSLSVAGQGGTASFTITCNDDWTITDIPDYVTVSQTSGTESSAVTVTAKQNFLYNNRNKSFTVKAGDKVKYISVKQNGVTSYSIGESVGKAGDMQDGQAYIIRNNSNNNYYWRAQNSKLVYSTWASGASIAYAFVYHRDDSKGKSSDSRYTSVSTGAWQSCHTGAYLDSKFDVYYTNISSAVYVANSNRWDNPNDNVAADTGNDIDMCQIGSTYSIAWNGSNYLWGSTSESNRKWLVYKAVPQY